MSTPTLSNLLALDAPEFQAEIQAILAAGTPLERDSQSPPPDSEGIPLIKPVRANAFPANRTDIRPSAEERARIPLPAKQAVRRSSRRTAAATSQPTDSQPVEEAIQPTQPGAPSTSRPIEPAARRPREQTAPQSSEPAGDQRIPLGPSRSQSGSAFRRSHTPEHRACIQPLMRASSAIRNPQVLAERIADILGSFTAPHALSVQELLELHARFPEELANSFRDFIQELRQRPQISSVALAPQTHSEELTGMPTFQGTCASVPCKIKLDSGASCAVMSLAFYTAHEQKLKDQGAHIVLPTTQLFAGADNQQLQSLGLARQVPFTINEQPTKFRSTFIVLPLAGTDLMLGGTFLNRTAAVLSYKTRTVTLHLPKADLIVPFELQLSYKNILGHAAPK